MTPVAGTTIGLVGAGRIAREHARAWTALGARVTVFSPSGGRAIVDEFGANAASGLDDLIASSDLLDVCSPTPTHPRAVEAGIDAGLPVVCEKPLALTVADARRLAARAELAGVLLYPAHVVRFFPAYADARRTVAAGDIGAARTARFLRMGAFPTWAPWFADDRLSGGIVLDQMIHDLDAARWILGEVTEVSGTITRSPTTSATVALTHASGAVTEATGVWGEAETAFATAFTIIGSTGEVVDDTREGPTDADAGGELPDLRGIDDPFEAELTDFLLVARGERPSEQARVSAADGVEAVHIARAAIESIETGRPITLASYGTDD